MAVRHRVGRQKLDVTAPNLTYMKHWIEAARVRTLPLSVSGILIGCFYAMSQSMFNWKIVLFALTTTLGLQVLSNFANDYGDGVKGTDNEDRIGPKRARSEEHTSELQSRENLVCRLLLEKRKTKEKKK